MYVTDVIGETYKHWQTGVVLINAGTGTGKTTFVVKELNEWAEITGTKILYLCNRRALKSQVIEQAEAEQKAKTLDDDAPDDSAGEEHLDIWTYQALEKMKLYYPEKLNHFLRQYRYIVADEAHYFMFDAQFNHDTVVSYDALKALWDQRIVIYMSATADYMFRQLKNMDAVKAEQRYNVDKDTNYVDRLQLYWNEQQLECWLNSIPDGEKALVFMETTDGVKKWRNKYGDAAVGYCSVHNKNVKKADALSNLKACLNNGVLQKKYTFTTKVLDNGVDVKDKALKHIFVETWEIDEAMQMFGRKRPLTEDDTCTFYIKGISVDRAGQLYKQVIADLEPGEALFAKAQHRPEKWEAFRKKSDAERRLYDFASVRIVKDTAKIEYNRMAMAGLRYKKNILSDIQADGYSKTLKKRMKWGLQDKVEPYMPPKLWRQETWTIIENAIMNGSPLKKDYAQKLLMELFLIEHKPLEEEATELLHGYDVTVVKQRWKKAEIPELRDKIVWLFEKK